MRYVSFLLLTLLILGCGSGSRNSDPLRTINLSVPSITTLTPNSAPVDSVAFTMTVSGTNFGTDAVVFWNGTPLRTSVVNSTELLAALADTDLMFAGLVHVHVRTGGLNTNTVDFDVTIQ